MIIICLDIDGVMYIKPSDQTFMKAVEDFIRARKLSNEPEISYNEVCNIIAVRFFNENAVRNLNTLIDLIEESGEEVGILIHSSWGINRSKESIQQLFSQHKFSKKIIGKTDDDDQLRKSKGIAKWLGENTDRYSIKDFIILEDQTVQPTEKLVLCKAIDGFTHEKLQEAIKLLSKSVKFKKILSDPAEVYAASGSPTPPLSPKPLEVKFGPKIDAPSNPSQAHLSLEYPEQKQLSPESKTSAEHPIAMERKRGAEIGKSPSLFFQMPANAHKKIFSSFSANEMAKAASASKDFRLLALTNSTDYAAARGQKIANEIKGKVSPAKAELLQTANVHLALGKGLITADEANVLSIFTIEALLTSNGLLALTKKLITPRQANTITPLGLEYLFSAKGLAALEEKLVSPESLLLLGGSRRRLDIIFSDNGLIALREGLITVGELAGVNDPIKAEVLIYSNNGLTALREGLLTLDKVDTFGLNELKAMLTDEGLMALRAQAVTAP